MNQLITRKRIIGVAFTIIVAVAFCFGPKAYAEAKTPREKAQATHSCVRVKGKFYNRDGKLTTEEKFYKECKYCVVEHKDGKATYYGPDEKEIDEDTFYSTDYCGCKKDNKKLPDLQDYLENYYSFSVDVLGGNRYKVSMDKGATDQGDVPFEVVSANKTTFSGLFVSIGNPVTVTADSSADNDYGIPGVVINLHAENVYDKRKVNECYYDSVDVVLTASDDMEETFSSTTCKNADLVKLKIKGSIDCSDGYESRYSTDPFSIAFCHDKNEAQKKDAKGHNNDYSTLIKKDESSKDGDKGAYTGNDIELYCNSDLNTLTTKKLSGEDYFVNKSYLYGSYETTIKGSAYQYEYTPGYVTDGDTPQCKVLCEEAVEVAYGPPVAAKAGACFEYNVRVTSRVSCGVEESLTISEPERVCDYCSPSPTCYGAGKYWTQGGPNEMFDSCVNACDGGKYTKKCSNQCYKQVYGFNAEKDERLVSNSVFDVKASNLGTRAIYTDDKEGTAVEKAIAACKEMTDANNNLYNPYGCYYQYANGTIKWFGKNSRTCLISDYKKQYGKNYKSYLVACGKGVEGRWYTENGSNSRYVFHSGLYGLPSNADGFWRKGYSWGYCNDTCWWNSCSKSKYINPGYAEKDVEKNVEIYNALVTKCNELATCRTTTSTYTINVNVKGKTKYNFPTFGSDSLTYSESLVSSSYSDGNGSTLLPNFPDKGEGLLGCYKDIKARKDLYRATWGFPGLWRNLKDGRLSKTKKAGYVLIPGEFCLPDDAVATNVKWYNKYYKKYMDEHGIKKDDVAGTYYWDKCESDIIKANYTMKESLEYNIVASTKSFGYFGWNININCAYAWNDNTAVSKKIDVNPKDCNPPGGGTTDEEPEVRTINPEEMFPTKDKNDNPIVGFNWSQEAEVDAIRNNGYGSNPVAYAEYVQNKAKSSGGVYDEDHLDYEFILSTSELRKLRQRSKVGGAYIAFTGVMDLDSNGNARYTSDVLRDNNLISPDDKKLPRDAALVCNNMINWKSNGCCDVALGSADAILKACG